MMINKKIENTARTVDFISMRFDFIADSELRNELERAYLFCLEKDYLKYYDHPAVQVHKGKTGMEYLSDDLNAFYVEGHPNPFNVESCFWDWDRDYKTRFESVNNVETASCGEDLDTTPSLCSEDCIEAEDETEWQLSFMMDMVIQELKEKFNGPDPPDPYEIEEKRWEDWFKRWNIPEEKSFSQIMREVTSSQNGSKMMHTCLTYYYIQTNLRQIAIHGVDKWVSDCKDYWDFDTYRNYQ